jgi:N-formylglutamate amidohydrolase
MIFHIPHAQAYVPDRERAGIPLNDGDLRTELARVTDWYTDELFAAAAKPEDDVVIYPVSRLVVDPERFENDAEEPMAALGVGVIYVRTSTGNQLRDPLTPDERERLLETYYRPHHRRLEAAVATELEQYGRSLIIDCHSFPSVPLIYDRNQVQPRPDFCIGTDSYHTPEKLTEVACQACEALGYSVEVNAPYAGSMVPSVHYRRDRRVASIMIEVNRRLYMDEKTTEKAVGFERTLQHNVQLVEALRREFDIHRSGNPRE